MPSFERARRAICLAAVAGSVAGCVTSPRAEALRQQQMIEMGDAINDTRLALSSLTETLDSLRVVIAKQDSTIARLANATGVQPVK